MKIHSASLKLQLRVVNKIMDCFQSCLVIKFDCPILITLSYVYHALTTFGHFAKNDLNGSLEYLD